MIQLLGLRDWLKEGRPTKREVFFNKGWRAQTIQEIFNPDSLQLLINEIPADERHNMYFTVADCYEATGRKLKEQWAIPFDIDKLHLPEDYTNEQCRAVAEEAARAGAEAIGVPYEDMGVCFSGNGVQFFVLLKEPIIDEQYFDNMRVQYGVLCKRIENKLLERNIRSEVDTSVWSKGRLMRLPNTLNKKPNKPQRTAQILNSTMVAHDFDLIERSGVQTVATDEISDVLLKNYPKPDTEAVTTGCKFLAHCKEAPNEVNEPMYYAMASITARLDNGRELTHAYASGYHSYSHYETENKIDQALASSGPRTCKSIDQLWDGCKACHHYNRITSPIMLKGDNYIASKDFGFRERKIKKDKVTAGRVMNQDLIKYFNSLHIYKVLKDNDQIVVFNGKYWEYMSDRQIRVWATEHIRPEPQVFETSEFLGQLKCYHVSSLDELNKGKEGYLNFSNCVLNTRTLETHPHSPTYGFFDVRDFAYDPRAESPLFDKFLIEIMDGDQEKAEILKEYGGYCISGDPCWLQKCLVLVGDGSNGKSIFMEILGDVVGKLSHAAIPMQELEKDTMRHYLVNKLFNYSEETSMKALSDSSTFKLLVTGGVMTVRQLYVQPYITENRAKLIISANNMPYSTDKSYGHLRRLLIVNLNVIFEAGTERHDPHLKSKLQAELPGICNTFLTAYNKLKDRGGMFSGMEKIREATKEYMEESDPTVMFINEFITDGEETDMVKVSEVYETFRMMCESYELKKISIVHFGKLLAKHKGLRSQLYKKDGATSRVYKGIKLQKGF